MKFDCLAVLLAVERPPFGCCYYLHPHFPYSSSQEERPKEAAMASGVPSGSGWDSGGSGRGPLPFLCLLAVPVPSSFAGPWEPELSVAPQLCHTEQMNLAGHILGFKSNPAGFWERRGSKSFSDVVETPGWVGMCPPKLLCHCLLANTANISGTQQAAFFFFLFNSYADNTWNLVHSCPFQRLGLANSS